MKKTSYIIAAVLIAVIVLAAFIGTYLSSHPTANSNPTSNVVQVVAAENFWGSLIAQLGGTRVHVFSIVTDPNADPHEYESSSADAIAIANARLVIVNGAGYDTWAQQLIAASNTPNQVVLNVQELINQPIGANPHFWYSPYYVNDTVNAMYKDLVSIDPTDTAYYTQQYAALNTSLAVYNGVIDQIKQQFGGTKVASTESIFVYLANAAGLDLVSPSAFMQAVSEGNDPPAQSIVQFDQLIQSGTVKVLVYNSQTVTPETQTIESMATQYHIPIVAITETVQPPTALFQDWMNSELIALQNALNQTASGK
ncbi:MAG: zinc ABC transporter substrate-binding protein [Candidatus Bathyarchaeia archaeon]|jgi:zinc/manganese transport system substrate-binding protein